MDYPQQHVKPYDSKSRKTPQVERMFDHIAPAYDRLNHTLSLGIDRYWRRKAIGKLLPFRPQRVLDVATGTAISPCWPAASFARLFCTASTSPRE